MKFWKVFVIMAASIIFSLAWTRVYAQFPSKEGVDSVEYCHIDIVDEEGIMHRNFSEEIVISKDSMIVNLEGEDKFIFLLGEYVYISGAKLESIRKVVNIEKPKDRLMALYVNNEVVSVKNVDTNGTVYFYIGKNCETAQELIDEGWYFEPHVELKKTE